MPIFEKLNKKLEKKVVVYPYKDIDDEHWAYTLDGEGNEVPAVPFEWRDVGYRVTRPDLKQIKFVESKSANLKAIKGMDAPYRDFDPAFIEHVCGVKGKKAIIEGTVGITTMEGDREVEKPYDPEWLCDLMNDGLFLYTEFMKTYNKLMESTKAKEEERKEKDENF